MPKSLVVNYIHVIFSTKNREPWLKSPVKEELFSYFGEVCSSLECYPISIGGYNDHVHILCELSKKIALIKLVEEIKANSSRWLKTKGKDYNNFYWQRGYGAFSISPSQLEALKQYIANQEQHHQKNSFQDEFRVILKKYDIDFDEKYLWD